MTDEEFEAEHSRRFETGDAHTFALAEARRARERVTKLEETLTKCADTLDSYCDASYDEVARILIEAREVLDR